MSFTNADVSKYAITGVADSHTRPCSSPSLAGERAEAEGLGFSDQMVALRDRGRSALRASKASATEAGVALPELLDRLW